MKKFTVILPLIFITFFTAIGHAAKIINVKGNKVLIDLESSRILIGETALVVDSSEKEVAQLKVVQIKGNRAIAEVLQGHVTLNLQVVKKNVSVAPQDGEDLLDGWYFGLGYDFAKPYISVQVGSQRSPVFVELTYQPAAFFSIGYEKVSFQKLGFIFSYIKESNSPLSQQSVTGSSASFASSSVDGLSLELGMTYGDSIKCSVNTHISFFNVS